MENSSVHTFPKDVSAMLNRALSKIWTLATISISYNDDHECLMSVSWLKIIRFRVKSKTFQCPPINFQESQNSLKSYIPHYLVKVQQI